MLRQTSYLLLSLILINLSIDISAASELMEKMPKDFKLPTPESEYDKNLLKNLETVNWHNVHIAKDGSSPAFAFTIGLFYKADHPEIIVVGLKSETAQQLLNIAATKVIGAKKSIVPYKKYTDMTEGLSLAFVPVSLEHYGEYLGYANWFYAAMPKPYPVLQMVWPDKAGIFPWEKGHDKRFSSLQPILGKW